MMRQDFLQVLEHDLSSLPVQAREEALVFFTEYLAEVGESSDALAELGDPPPSCSRLVIRDEGTRHSHGDERIHGA
ncbi:HAAS signaling domain-containing protein [Streptococcus dysgalactiae]|uniref:HAAS signaling domain-containing protein n=1 Tax=Streptococcus dysgalactiae TaxID=1334 RepID=UPI000E0162A7|nr:hypothetical protein [Streptococcus dysgalactiae]SUN46077.1 Predicted membrane protein [Streptococcus dysgalactiae subsp. dysgalactiae]SUN50916.1 Predicted membrane protein [Streptococcus dysgalactiae]